MSGTARSHTKLRRTPAGTRLLDRRSRGALGSDRKVAGLLRRLYRPDVQDEIARLLDESDGRVLGVRPHEWVRLASERFHRFVVRLPDPATPDPPSLPVRTFLLDGCAHVVTAAPGTRLADAPCLGCGAEATSLGRCQRCDPDGVRYGRDYRPLPAHPWVLRLLSSRNDCDVVTLVREATSTSPIAVG